MVQYIIFFTEVLPVRENLGLSSFCIETTSASALF